MRTFPQFLWLAAGLVCSRGAAQKPVVPLSGGQTSASVTTAADSTAGHYSLEAGDTIEIKFFYNTELNDTIQIRPDGRISLLLIGEAVAAGQTIPQFSAALTEKYKGILRQPEISIQIRNYANRKIFVGGEVTRPGMIPLVGKQTLLAAIMEAGGLRSTANRSEAFLIRKSEIGLLTTQRLSLKDHAAAAGVILQPFDVVIVNRSRVAKVDQAIDQYIRQMIPATLNGGFSYLFNAGGVIVP
jgi:polysaccharide biosynthesis/export protein